MIGTQDRNKLQEGKMSTTHFVKQSNLVSLQNTTGKKKKKKKMIRITLYENGDIDQTGGRLLQLNPSDTSWAQLLEKAKEKLGMLIAFTHDDVVVVVAAMTLCNSCVYVFHGIV
jgi:hypothetical protein